MPDADILSQVIVTDEPSKKTVHVQIGHSCWVTVTIDDVNGGVDVATGHGEWCQHLYFSHHYPSHHGIVVPEWEPKRTG